MQDESAPFRAGDVVAGRYRVEALLGQGGFGVVYRAVQLNIGRAVALKMLLAETLAHPEGLARFRREAELAQRLEHPNTVRLYDFGETEQGLPFIAWEMLRGRPLDAVLHAEGGLSPARVARIATQTLKALMEAHAYGIIHRDLKPANLFLCEFSGEPDFVKVLDFGIAKSLSDGPGLTTDGVIIGTPNYMPPEQVGGHEVTPATDLYALGLVMAEALLGRPVFIGAAGLALCMEQLSNAPVPLPPSVLASPLGSVIARATQKSPAARFASAAEMLARLEESVPQASGGAAVGSAPMRASPGGHRPTAFAATGLAPTPPGAAPPRSRPTAFAATGLASAFPSTPAAQPGPTPVHATMASNLASPSMPEAFSAPWNVPRNLLVAVVAVSALAAGALVALRLMPAGERNAVERTVERAVEPGHGNKARAGLGPATGRRFAQLTPPQLRARIEDAGYKVGAESTTESISYWIVEPRTDNNINSVFLYRYPDLATAEGAVRVQKEQGHAAARDGNTVLSVQLAQHGAAEALLQRLTR